MSRPITFLSDYGYADEFAGVCRAVMARITPDARITDITHGLRRHAVRQGAVLLANSLPYAEPGIHLAVIDPGVGSDRRPVAVGVADEGRVLVGPDNGVLGLAIERLGGPRAAVDLTASPFRLQPVTTTFHGRDLFAPVAAHLAAGAQIAEVGEAIALDSLTRLALPEPRVYSDRVVAHVLYVDGFGNVTLNLGHEDLSSTFLRLGRRVSVDTGGVTVSMPFARTFSDVGEGQALLYEDSARALALAVNRHSAAEMLGLAPDDEVTLSAAD
jgi:S-adenosylmethionine hydrolase